MAAKSLRHIFHHKNASLTAQLCDARHIHANPEQMRYQYTQHFCVRNLSQVRKVGLE
jgi:hypothetical protein